MIPVSYLFEEEPVVGQAPGGGFLANMMNKAKRFLPGAGRPKVPGSPELGVRKLVGGGDEKAGGVGRVLSSIGKRNALLKAAAEG